MCTQHTSHQLKPELLASHHNPSWCTPHAGEDPSLTPSRQPPIALRSPHLPTCSCYPMVLPLDVSSWHLPGAASQCDGGKPFVSSLCLAHGVKVSRVEHASAPHSSYMQILVHQRAALCSVISQRSLGRRLPLLSVSVAAASAIYAFSMRMCF